MKALLGSAAVAMTVLAGASFGSATPAAAKGCIKGALVGGVAGHYAGRHGVLGAVAGCVTGRYLSRRAARAEQQRRLQAQRGNGYPPAGSSGRFTTQRQPISAPASSY